MKNILSYNEKDQWTKRAEFGSDNTADDSVTFEYDKSGNLIKETTCCKYNFFHSYNYKLDKRGNWIEREKTYTQKNENGEDETRNDMNYYRVITYYSDYETKP